MRTPLALTLTLFLTASAVAAELHVGTERSFFDVPVSGVAAAGNARGTLVVWSEARGAFMARLEEPTRPVQLPRWGAVGTTVFRGPAAVATDGRTFLIVWSESTGRDTRRPVRH